MHNWVHQDATLQFLDAPTYFDGKKCINFHACLVPHPGFHFRRITSGVLSEAHCMSDHKLPGDRVLIRVGKVWTLRYAVLDCALSEDMYCAPKGCAVHMCP